MRACSLTPRSSGLTPRRSLRLCWVVLVVIGLGACTSALRWSDSQYVVRQGDTLYAIALRFDVDIADLRRWNQLGRTTLILPGQALWISPPTDGTWADSKAPRAASGAPRAPSPSAASRSTQTSPAPASAAPKCVWPASGRVATGFVADDPLSKGIDISGNPGDPIFAAAAGEVVYSGSGLIGYGNLIIVKHDERFFTAYGHNEELLVSEGDQVVTGQAIARMGLNLSQEATLHFEIREYGKPSDPLRHLPSRGR